MYFVQRKHRRAKVELQFQAIYSVCDIFYIFKPIVVVGVLLDVAASFLNIVGIIIFLFSSLSHSLPLSLSHSFFYFSQQLFKWQMHVWKMYVNGKNKKE